MPSSQPTLYGYGQRVRLLIEATLMMGWVNRMLWLASAEFVFRARGLANGSGVIVFRSLWVATWVTTLMASIALSIAPWLAAGAAGSSPLSSSGHDSALFWINSIIAWFGAVFGFTYAGLYARFASQWTYLADLYNSIKRAQLDVALSATNEPFAAGVVAAVADMKHGFVEDAVLLHLACKQSFCVAVACWLQDPAVKQAIVNECTDGLVTYARLFSDACEACARFGKKVPLP